MPTRHECDCGAVYHSSAEVIACADRQHGTPRSCSECVRLRDRILQLEMWLCPHREILDDGREAEGESVQCEACAGIIYSPELIAIRRAERAEALIREAIRLLDSREQWTDEWHAGTAANVAALRALLADLDARAGEGKP